MGGFGFGLELELSYYFGHIIRFLEEDYSVDLRSGYDGDDGELSVIFLFFEKYGPKLGYYF